MNIVRKKEALVLFLVDIFVLSISLYLALTFRYGALPTREIIMDHFVPFSILFAVSVFIYFIAGLYEKHTLILKSKLPGLLTRVQIINALVSISFFYFIPYFVITPKVILFMYLVISLIIMVAWRMAVAQTFSLRRKYKALLMASGNEISLLYHEINNNPRYGTYFVEWIDVKSGISQKNVFDLIKSNNISLIVADFNDQKVNEIMPSLYNLIFSGVRFVDSQKIYEEIFDRVALSLINDSWFMENVSSATKTSFDLFKRALDIVTSIVFGIISLAFYPFVWIAIKLDDGGVVFSSQDRVGQNNKIVTIYKFRTMTLANDEAKWGKSRNTVTKAGNFLRKTRIDELPQFWNVFKGDISLVGPRPEFAGPVAEYAREIPYYNVRHIVKPGLFGWAQIYHERHPHHGLDTEETRNKLSYDLYYIKNRSLILDIKIIFRSIKILLSFVGR